MTMFVTSKHIQPPFSKTNNHTRIFKPEDTLVHKVIGKGFEMFFNRKFCGNEDESQL